MSASDSRREGDEASAEISRLRSEVATLRRALEFFQGAVDALPFPIFWKDEQSVYVGANREQALRSGLERGGEIAGLSDDDLPWTTDEAAAFRADDRRVMTLGEVVAFMETQHIPGKGQRQCETHKAPLRDASGEVIGVVGWYEDVTDREEQKRAQSLLDERLRGAHKQDSLGTLAAGIAHDFNNILASIMANLWLVQMALPADHPAAESLADIQQAGLRAKRLVEQLLEIKPQQPRSLGPVSVGELVNEATSLLRATIPPDIDLSTDVDTALLVRGDASQLHQVIINLCTNACLATRDRPGIDPKVEVRVTALALDRDTLASISGNLAPGEFVVLSIGDNGVGMDEVTQRRMFEPFFTTREVGAGSGLGLAVVHGVVAAHDGAIEVQSSPGAGTTVRVYLPKVSAEAGDAPVKSVRRPSSRPPSAMKRVLYVDDDDSLLRVVRRLLQREGCSVTTCQDPRDAAALIEKEPGGFDLLIVDLSMPHLSGLELARRAIELFPGMPVALVSGYLTAGARCDAEALGVTYIIDKVDVAQRLKDAVRALSHEPAAF
jgi:signal transduction histidine kinase/CheY-like chemotaxis protein